MVVVVCFGAGTDGAGTIDGVAGRTAGRPGEETVGLLVGTDCIGTDNSVVVVE